MSRLARACKALGIRHPNQFAWFHMGGGAPGEDLDLMLSDLGWRGRGEIRRVSTRWDGKLGRDQWLPKPVYELRVPGRDRETLSTLSAALEALRAATQPQPQPLETRLT